MGNRVVSTTEFKAKCLALLDEVEESGSTITVTKRGKAVATVRPARKKAWRSPEGMWAGKAKFLEDLLDKDTSFTWDCAQKPERSEG